MSLYHVTISQIPVRDWNKMGLYHVTRVWVYIMLLYGGVEIQVVY